MSETSSQHILHTNDVNRHYTNTSTVYDNNSNAAATGLGNSQQPSSSSSSPPQQQPPFDSSSTSRQPYPHHSYAMVIELGSSYFMILIR